MNYMKTVTVPAICFRLRREGTAPWKFILRPTLRES